MTIFYHKHLNLYLNILLNLYIGLFFRTHNSSILIGHIIFLDNEIQKISIVNKE